MSENTTADDGSDVEGEVNIRLPRQHLQEYLNAANALVDEAAIRVTDDGLVTRAVDPANVAMVRSELSNSAFTENHRGEAAFGIDTRKIGNLVEGIDSGFVDLDYDDTARKLELASGPYRYTHAAMDIDTLRNEPDIPDLDLSFKAKINIDQLREAVEWFDEFTTHVRAGYDPERQKFWMEANERRGVNKMGTDDGVFEIDRSDLGYVHRLGHADSQFSVDYFRDIVQAVPEGRTATIIMGEEFPMKLSYEIGWEETGPNEGFAHGEVTFFQAPRIQSD